MLVTSDASLSSHHARYATSTRRSFPRRIATQSNVLLVFTYDQQGTSRYIVPIDPSFARQSIIHQGRCLPYLYAGHVHRLWFDNLHLARRPVARCSCIRPRFAYSHMYRHGGCCFHRSSDVAWLTLLYPWFGIVGCGELRTQETSVSYPHHHTGSSADGNRA